MPQGPQPPNPPQGIIDPTMPLVKDGKTIGELIMQMIMEMEGFRLIFNNIGSPQDNQLLDLIEARLVNNNEFLKKVGRAIHDAAVESAARRTAAASHPTVTTANGEQVAVGSEITSGGFAFTGNEGYVVVELDETGEGVANGVLHANGAEPRPLDLEDRKDYEILNAVNRTYKHLTTMDPPTNVAAGDKIWYQITLWHDKNPITGEPYPTRIIRGEPTPEVKGWVLQDAPALQDEPSAESDDA